MAKLTKKQKEAVAKFDGSKVYSLEEAVSIVKKITFTKFDSSVDIDVRLGVDPRKANQMVRGSVTLPHGTGKTVRVLVLCTPDKEEEAKAAGADYYGLDEYITKIKGGWTDVDVIITMPSCMPKIGALGRILGPRGLMPNPKTGTVTMEVGKAVQEAKAAGADYYGLDEYIAKIKGGWTDVDVIITMPSCMPKIGALGRILGPRGLMPNPKTGTVTMEVGKAVQEAKAGKIDFKVDKFGIIHTAVAKCSFDEQKIVENTREVLQMIMKLKPSAAKGTYVKSIAISSTMSPGVKVDTKAATL